MAESTLTLGFPEFQAELGEYLGYGRTTGNWSTAQTTNVESLIQQGLRQFLFHARLPEVKSTHRWGFLHPWTTLTLNAPYSTGTIVYDHTGGSNELEVTLSDGTWPSWAASGKIEIDGSRYDVSTRESDTVLTLESNSNPGEDVAAGTSYELTQEDYEMDDDFGGIIGDFYFGPNDSYTRVRVTSPSLVQADRAGTISSGRPDRCAVVQKTTDLSDGQRWETRFWPTPDAAYTLHYRYNLLINKIDASNPYPPGGMAFAETILASMLAVAERRMDGEIGVENTNYLEKLQQAIEEDLAHQQKWFGYNADQGMDDDDHVWRNIQESRHVRYNGSRIT